MSPYTQVLYQIVFCTKYRKPTLSKNNRQILFKYIWGILKRKKCHLFRINGVDDHIHLILSLHPSVSLSNLVKDIKVASTIMIKKEGIFPSFLSWQTGYAAFTYSIESKYRLIEYVKNQEIHHAKVSFKDELISLLKENGIDFDEKFLE